MKTILFTFSFSCLSFIATAQDSLQYKAEVKELIELMQKKEQNLSDYFNVEVSTTTRNTTEKSDRAAATVWVVTDEQITLRAYQSLLDVLYDMPDLKIDHAVDPRWANDVSIRGIRGMDKFVILLDGVRISSPTNDIIPILENYPVCFAKQIEIICGPASAQYGADAFSGIINIISKSADDIRKNRLNLIGGTYNTYTGNLLVSRNFSKDMSFVLAGQYHYDRMPRLWEYYPEDYKGIKEIHQTGVLNTVFGRVQYNKALDTEPNQTALSAYGVFAKFQWKDLKISGFLNNSTNPSTFAGNPNNVIYNYGNYFGHSVGTLSATYDKQIGQTWKLTSYLINSHYWLDPESAFQNVYTGFEKAYLFSVGRMWKAEQLVTWTPSSKFSFTGGATYENFFSVPR
ncbi:MAG: TonB-dependent receptor plug domain-containing protein, partial [Thermoflexibacteraceae bacterium]